MVDKHIFLTGDEEKDTKRVTYFIFITAVSLLSLGVAGLYYIVPDREIRQVLFILDTFYALMFLVDFFLRLRTVENRKNYIVHWGWLDFVTSIPGLPALRIIRSIRVMIDARQIFAIAPDEIAAQARSRIAESVLFITLFVGMIILTVGSIAIVVVEADAPGAEITTGYDAIWWSLVTVSTVGYGDEYPVTVEGRTIGLFMISVGVALFTTITSYLASTFTDKGARQQRDLQLQIAESNAEHMEEILQRIYALEQAIAGKLDVEVPQEGDEDGT